MSAAATAHGFAATHEETYRNPISFKDFAQFEARSTAVDPARAAVFAEHRATFADSFAALAEPSADGYRFYQPGRINLFRRT